MKILVLAPFDDGEVAKLRELGDVTYESWIEHKRLTGPDDLADRLNREGFDVVVVEAEFVTGDVLRAVPGLRVIGSTRGKPVNVDIATATELGKVVLQTPGRNADAVADLCLAMILDRVRHVSEADRAVRQGGWEFSLDKAVAPYLRFRGYDLRGRLLGLIGLGAVGQAVAARAQAFGMRVQAYDPYLPAEEFAASRVESVELDDLMRTSDVVSLHVELNPNTIDLLDDRRLRLMKPGSIFVNTARAKVTDQDTLTELALSGHLGGLALDVFDPEPIPSSHPLLGCERALILPHIGGATDDVVRNHSRMIREDLERIARGERPQRCANPEVLEALSEAR
ncbi:MAG TPA: NAD(P)-dependent oxidoreductase [Candidatus Dormibacteraeota bacterium]|nr:NAD(P)-dependent oxidoreductase [Candidatus Dormibacteraeota bacterium]